MQTAENLLVVSTPLVRPDIPIAKGSTRDRARAIGDTLFKEGSAIVGTIDHLYLAAPAVQTHQPNYIPSRDYIGWATDRWGKLVQNGKREKLIADTHFWVALEANINQKRNGWPEIRWFSHEGYVDPSGQTGSAYYNRSIASQPFFHGHYSQGIDRSQLTEEVAVPLNTKNDWDLKQLAFYAQDGYEQVNFFRNVLASFGEIKEIVKAWLVGDKELTTRRSVMQFATLEGAEKAVFEIQKAVGPEWINTILSHAKNNSSLSHGSIISILQSVRPQMVVANLPPSDLERWGLDVALPNVVLLFGLSSVSCLDGIIIKRAKVGG